MSGSKGAGGGVRFGGGEMVMVSEGNWVARAALKTIARLALFFIVVALVWVAFVYLYAVYPDTLGWIYTQLRPITIWLYGLIDNNLPASVKYKVSAGLSDELGPRALLLLILGALAELAVLTIWYALTGLVHLSRRTATRSRQTA